MRFWQDWVELGLKAIAVAALVAWVYFSLTWLYRLQLIPFVEVAEPCLSADCVSSPLR